MHGPVLKYTQRLHTKSSACQWTQVVWTGTFTRDPGVRESCEMSFRMEGPIASVPLRVARFWLHSRVAMTLLSSHPMRTGCASDKRIQGGRVSFNSTAERCCAKGYERVEMQCSGGSNEEVDSLAPVPFKSVLNVYLLTCSFSHSLIVHELLYSLIVHGCEGIIAAPFDEDHGMVVHERTWIILMVGEGPNHFAATVFTSSVQYYTYRLSRHPLISRYCQMLVADDAASCILRRFPADRT